MGLRVLAHGEKSLRCGAVHSSCGGRQAEEEENDEKEMKTEIVMRG